MDATPPRPDAGAAEHPGRRGIAALLELAGPTDGWFLSSDAVARGVSPSTLTRLRSRGLIETPRKNLNRLTSFPDSWTGRARAALWGAGERAALGRHAAVRVLTGSQRSVPIDLVGPRAAPASTTTVAVRGHSRLRPGDVRVHAGLRVTSATFTVCDLAAVVSEAALLRRADRFIAVAAFSLEDLRLMTARFREIEGVEKLRSVLDQLAPSSRWTRSDGERMWLRIVRELDVPEPQANHRVPDADGNVRYLDFAWPEHKLAVEIDLHPTHGTTIGRRDDGRRQNALVLAGWTVLRFDLADLMTRPDYVLRTVEQAIRGPRQL